MVVFAKLFVASEKKRKEGVSSSRISEKDHSKTGESKAMKRPRDEESRPNHHHATNNNTTNSKRRKNDAPHQSRHQQQQQQHPPPRKRSGAPPSAAALELSRQLQELSRQKRLDRAVQLYWDRVTDGTADQHHACIVVDCAARCGDVATAERIVQQQQQPLSVETQTALLKGYAHAGRLHNAVALFRTMARPNVRTLNTLLRGCLWTAVTLDEGGEFVGGVVSSEVAWQLYHQQATDAAATLDASSYEYSISLLCQALRTREAEERIDLFQRKYAIRVKGMARISGGDQASLETLAVVYLGLSRAYALLGKLEDLWRCCQRALCAIKLSRAQLLGNTNTTAVVNQGEADTDSKSSKKRQRGASGGKRGWKSSRDSEETTATTTFRDSSNVAFRTHRLSELESEVRALLKSRGKLSNAMSRETMCKSLQTRLLYFSGGGTTEVSAVQGMKTELHERSGAYNDLYLTSAWMSYGLSQFTVNEVDKCTTDPSPTDKIDPSLISRRCGFSKVDSVLHRDGTIHFGKVFDHPKRPLYIEIGAGFGTWICQQAQEYTDRNHVAVELRADRVSQIFARLMLDSDKPLDNVCAVGAECGSFFRDRIQRNTVSCIFANYPEPPTQTHGDDQNDLRAIADGSANEPAHMLNSTTIIEMSHSLKTDGKIVIVSDNRFYARLLAATLARVVRQEKNLIRSVKPSELKHSSLRHMEAFSSAVDLYQGQPAQAIGHAKNSSSYFDRLWRTGAGSHSERRTRFVLLMQRC